MHVEQDTPKDRIIVLGVGNILLKDEGVGVRTIEALQARYSFPENVKIVDGGTQGLWLLSTLQQTDHLVVVDAVLGDGPPGTHYRLERQDLPIGLRAKTSAHDSDLVECLNICTMLEEGPKSVVIVGIQPADITPYGIELTPVVAAKVDELIDRVLDELKVFGIVAQKKV